MCHRVFLIAVTIRVETVIIMTVTLLTKEVVTTPLIREMVAIMEIKGEILGQAVIKVVEDIGKVVVAADVDQRRIKINQHILKEFNSLTHRLNFIIKFIKFLFILTEHTVKKVEIRILLIKKNSRCCINVKLIN